MFFFYFLDEWLVYYTILRINEHFQIMSAFRNNLFIAFIYSFVSFDSLYLHRPA